MDLQQIMLSFSSFGEGYLPCGFPLAVLLQRSWLVGSSFGVAVLFPCCTLGFWLEDAWRLCHHSVSMVTCRC